MAPRPGPTHPDPSSWTRAATCLARAAAAARSTAGRSSRSPRGRAGLSVLAPFSLGGGSTTGFDVEGGLAIDGAGNLYGAANAGGANGKGTIFELAAGSGIVTPRAQMPGVFNHPQTLIID